MTRSETIVSALLEDRACAACQKELGIRPAKGQTHGYCKRHAAQWMKDELGPGEAERFVTGKPDDYFCPDLGQH